MSLQSYTAIIFVVLGLLFLYRAITGNTRAARVESLSDQLPAASSRQRRVNAALGICFIAIALAYIVRAYARHSHF